jgi:hypothetical protein
MTALHTNYIIDNKGKKRGVFLTIKEYQKLIEDLHDLAIVAERRHEKVLNLATMKRKLKKDDLI